MHVVGTVEGSTMKLFVNGVVVVQNTAGAARRIQDPDILEDLDARRLETEHHHRARLDASGEAALFEIYLKPWLARRPHPTTHRHGGRGSITTDVVAAMHVVSVVQYR